MYVDPARRFVIWDDVLADEDLEAARQHAEEIEYQRVGHSRWHSAWPADSVPVFQGPTEFSHWTNAPLGVVGSMTAAVITRVSSVPEVLGRAGEDWDRLSHSVWLYPRGSELGLHVDGRHFAGAFILYLNRTWRYRWGGHLIVFDADVTNRRPPVADFEDEAEALMGSGTGFLIMPKPNRLVFLAPATAHAVSQISDSAGDRLRVSWSGFFHRIEASADSASRS